MKSLILFGRLICLAALLSLPLAGSARGELPPPWSGLSLEEKIGQVMVVYFEGPELSPNLEKLVGDLKVGGVILYSSRGNIQSPSQVARLCDSLQSFAAKSESLPLLIAIDQEGGEVQRITKGVPRYPGNMALGAAGDEELTEQVASAMARDLHSMGINMNFAPVADVNNNPRNPVIGARSFGASPALVARLAAIMASGFSREGVIPVAKHFPGHGNTDGDSHSGLPMVPSTREDLEKTEFLPFRELIAAGVPAVMTAHVLLPVLDEGRPATLSPVILRLLREEMGFTGVIITDSLAMGALKRDRTTAEAAEEALMAGADMLLFGADKGYEEEEHFQIYSHLLQAAREGRISMERLDDAVGRVLELKEKNLPSGDFNIGREVTGGGFLAEETARKSVTLIRPWKEGADKISRGESIPLLWPRERSEGAWRILERCPFFTLYALPERPSEVEVLELEEKLKGEKVIFAGEYDCWKNELWLGALKALGQERLFIISAGTPYSLLSLPLAAGSMALYSHVPASIDALCAILLGEALPQGALPVELPGLYPLGWGVKEFF